MPYPLEVLAWIAGGLTAVGIIWSKGIIPAAAWIRRTVERGKNLARIIDTLADIAAQFRPNGGNSLHDNIASIKVDVAQVKRDTEALKQDTEALKHSVKVVQEEEMAALNLMLAQVISEQKNVADDLAADG
jgi:uncharacterized alpha-E superfamily protein